jgi:hypothetical protein
MPRDIVIDAPLGKALVRIVEGQVVFEKTGIGISSTITISGGGVTTSSLGHQVEPVRTSTTTSSHSWSDFWIDERDGSRHGFRMPGSFTVGTGHEVRMVSCGRAGSDREPVLMFGWNRTLGFTVRTGPLRTGTTADDSPDLWDWAVAQGLARYPWPYRLVFHCSPLLLLAYLALFWVPVSRVWSQARFRPPRPVSWSEFAYYHGVAFADWSPAIVWHTYAGHGVWPWVGLLAGIVVTLVVSGLTMLAGWLLLGWAWRRVFFKPWRDKLLALFER